MPVGTPQVSTAPTESVELRRLSPATILLRFLVSVPGYIVLLAPGLRSPDAQSVMTLMAAVIYAAVTLPIILLRFAKFRYGLSAKTVTVRKGVLNTQLRNIPMERIQNVEVEQKLLPRLLRLAGVKIVTAGSTGPEAVIEYVRLGEAHRIREHIRQFRPGTSIAAAEGGAGDTTRMREEPDDLLSTVTAGKVLLAGLFRFSLIYIAAMFSILQLVDPDPLVVIDMISGRFADKLEELAKQSPILTLGGAAFLAVILGWLTGIVVTINRYFGFTLSEDAGRIHWQSGALTRSQGTIPLKKIQALIVRSNLVMHFFNWSRLEAQTMGLDVRQQGHTVLLPIGRRGEIDRLVARFLPLRRGNEWLAVSSLHRRRLFVRYAVAILVAATSGGLMWTPLWWLFVLVVPAASLAHKQYKRHTYQLNDDSLIIRRGVVQTFEWVLPIKNSHVMYTTQTILQRRLGLKSVYVDFAGASSMNAPTIRDLPADVADALVEQLYSRFARSVHLGS